MANTDHLVIDGFTVIPVKFNQKSKSCHYLYAKEHNVRGVDLAKPADKTLFVLNVPPYCNEECLMRLFQDYGEVDRVSLQKKPSSNKTEDRQSTFFPSTEPVKGFKVAYVVFRHKSSVQNIKSISLNIPLYLSTEDNPIVTGIEKWCQEYACRKPKVEDLQSEIDTFMQKYDAKIEEEKAKEKEMEGQEDEDGWVTVTKHGKNKGVPRTEAHEKRTATKEKKRRKEKELLNFYAFQMRDSKKEKIAELRRKFEEDKNKIATLKAQRKFRPY